MTFVGVIMVIEAITHTHIIQGLASAITGNPVDYRSSPRMGLLRAQGPFSHPISAGIFLSSFLPLYWLAGFKGWVRGLGAFAALCSIVTVSSATLLSLVAAIGLLVYNWLSERIINLTWKLFFFASGLVVFALELGTGAGVFGSFVFTVCVLQHGKFVQSRADLALWDGKCGKEPVVPDRLRRLGAPRVDGCVD